MPAIPLPGTRVMFEGFENYAVANEAAIAENNGGWLVLFAIKNWIIAALDGSTGNSLEIQLGSAIVWSPPPEGNAYAELDPYNSVAITRSLATIPDYDT